MRLKRWMSFLLALLLLAGCSGAAENAYRHISQEEAAELMETEDDCVILDVRMQVEYNMKHIPGAICIPNETIGKEKIPQLPDKDQLILVYCRTGKRSQKASRKLANLGYTNVAEFGGIEDWTGEVILGEAWPDHRAD